MNPQKKKKIVPAVKPVVKPGQKGKIQPKTKTTGKGNRYIILFFFIWSLILYGNTIRNKYSVDDINVTGPKNELVKKGFAAIPEIMTTNYLVDKGNIGSQISEYRPLVKVTFAIEDALWGEGKAGRSHAINILLYFWISTVLFFILKRILKDYNILFPFLVTILFMAHPIHTEVVASLKNRDEMLAFLFGLFSLKYTLDYAEKKKAGYIFLAMLMFMLGYISKSSILPFIAIIPLTLYFFTEMKMKHFIMIFSLLIAAGLIAYIVPRFFILHGIRVNSYIENPLYFEKSFWIRTGTAMSSLLFYLKMLVFPYPLRFYYGYNMIPLTNWANLWVLLSLVLYAGLLVYAIRKLKEKSLVSYAILFYLVFISMYSNLVVPAVGIVAERFLFAASLGFIIALVYYIFKLVKTDPKSLTIEISERTKIVVIIFLLLIPSTAMTIARNRSWRNIGDLYRADIKKLDNSVKANVDFGEYLVSTIYNDPNFIQHGAVNEFKQQVIIGHFRRALDLYPDNYQVLNDLSTVYLRFSDKTDSAVYFLKKAMASNDTLQPAWVNLALAYRKLGKPDSALYCYQRILQMNPNELNATFKIADVYFEKGDFNKAISMNEEVIRQHPDLHIPYFNIGYYYFQKGDTAVAVKYWEQSYQKRPTFEAGINLYNMYKAKGDMERANYYYQGAQQAQNAREKVNQ